MSTILRVAAPTGIAETILVRGVAELLHLFPELRVEIKDGQTPDVLDYLLRKSVDVGLAGANLGREKGIEAAKIRHWEENVLAISKAKLSALQDTLSKDELAHILSRYVFIGREPTFAGVQDRAQKYIASLNLGIEIDFTKFSVKSLEGSVRAVAAGIGVALLPKGTIEEICPYSVKGLRIPPDPDESRRESGESFDRCQFYMAWRKGHVLSDIELELCRILGAIGTASS